MKIKLKKYICVYIYILIHHWKGSFSFMNLNPNSLLFSFFVLSVVVFSSSERTPIHLFLVIIKSLMLSNRGITVAPYQLRNEGSTSRLAKQSKTSTLSIKGQYELIFSISRSSSSSLNLANYTDPPTTKILLAIRFLCSRSLHWEIEYAIIRSMLTMVKGSIIT